MKFTIKPNMYLKDLELPQPVWELWRDEEKVDYANIAYGYHEHLGVYLTKEDAEFAAKLVEEYSTREEYLYEI